MPSSKEEETAIVVRGVREQDYWREANRALTTQASCSPEDTWVIKAHFLQHDCRFDAFRELAGVGELQCCRL